MPFTKGITVRFRLLRLALSASRIRWVAATQNIAGIRDVCVGNLLARAASQVDGGKGPGRRDKVSPVAVWLSEECCASACGRRML